ncbi:MAG TPA: hypothetical protein VGE59_04925 [Patescibacteria group bacterium]
MIVRFGKGAYLEVSNEKGNVTYYQLQGEMEVELWGNPPMRLADLTGPRQSGGRVHATRLSGCTSFGDESTRVEIDDITLQGDTETLSGRRGGYYGTLYHVKSGAESYNFFTGS